MDVEKNTPETPETQPAPAEIAATTSKPPEFTDGTEAMDEACRREVSVEIPADVVGEHHAALVKEYSRRVRIPGFRIGKVPASMVRNRFSGEIANEVLFVLAHFT